MCTSSIPEKMVWPTGISDSLVWFDAKASVQTAVQLAPWRCADLQAALDSRFSFGRLQLQISRVYVLGDHEALCLENGCAWRET